MVEYLGKKVKLIDCDGKTWCGVVEMFTPAIDNESEQDEIALKLDARLIAFTENEIKNIAVCNE